MSRSKIVAAGILATLVCATAASVPTSPTVIAFDGDSVGQAPRGFSFGRTGGGGQGKWVVQSEKDAPSGPNVLAQLDADPTDYRFAVAVADAPTLKDGKVKVRCKPVSGEVDEACGLVFRYQDENDYYVTRANALEGNTRLYFVRDGKRKQIASHSGKVAKGIWHELGVEVAGDHIQVFFEGKKIIDAHDRTFSAPGKVGVWTKADSVTWFDDLTINPE